jgi:hypothetical protein
MEAHVSKLGDRRGSKLGPNARSILEAGREGDNPTPDDRARVKRALMRTLAAGAVASATSAAASSAGAAAPLVAKGTSIGLGIKLFGAAVLILATAGGVLLQRASSPDPAVAPGATVAGARDRDSVAPPKLDGAIAAPARAAAVDPAAPARANELVPPEKPRASAAPSSPRIAAREPVALDEPEAVTPAPAAAPQPAIPEEDPLAAETRRLREAHGALQAGDAQKALALLGEQGGQLGEERAAARVLALCQLGRIAESEAARDAFLREHPRSPLAARVRGGCAPSITNTK